VSATGFPALRSGPAGPSRRFDLATALTHLILIVACLTILLPILWTARTSFASRRLAYDPATLLFVPTLDNYTKIFVGETFLKYFWNSL
jgi:multiple sugar transport system permease protein